MLTSDASVVRDSDPAVIVEGDGGHFAGASGAVLVVAVVAGHRIVVIVVDVGTGARVLKHRQSHPSIRRVFCTLDVFYIFRSHP